MSKASVISLVVFLLQNPVLLSANKGSAKDVVATFSNPYIADEYNRLAVHKETGNVYVGAVNRIYQLDQNLQIIRSYVTAGLADKNVNKALVIDYERNMLLACGSAGGNCSCSSLDDITRVKTEYNGGGLIAEAESNVVAFIGQDATNETFLCLGISKNTTAKILDRSLVPSENFKILRKTEKIENNNYGYSKEPINLVIGFSAKEYSYYLMNDYNARLVRVFQNRLNSGIVHEIEISCDHSYSYTGNVLVVAAYVGRPGHNLARSMGVNSDDDILFAAFSLSRQRNRNNSFVCIYPVKQLQSENTVIRAESAIYFSNFQVASISAVAQGDNTILFLGSNDGKLKRLTNLHYNKNNRNERYEAVEYDEREINSGSKILPGMFFDKETDYVYVATKPKVFKLRVRRNCSEYNTCDECVKTEPSCGWCTVTNSCSMIKDCSIVEERSTSFLTFMPFGSDECNQIDYTTSLLMKVMSEEDIIMLNVTLTENLHVQKNMTCKFAFSNKTAPETFAKSLGHNVLCLTPPKSQIPDIAAGKHHVSAKLLIKSIGLAGVEDEHYVSNFTVYDCGTYNTCTSCLSSQFNCSWCFWKHRCMDRNDCRIKDVKQCPSITTGNGTQEYLIPYGTVKRVEIKTSLDHIVSDKTTVQSYFHCRFHIEGRMVYTSSILFGDFIHCDAIQFVYTSNVPSLVVSVDVISDIEQHVSLDNPSNFTVLIYRCQYMADDCESCLKTEKKFGCGWCESSSRCTTEENCGYGLNWIKENQSCPSLISLSEVVLIILLLLLSIIIVILIIHSVRKTRTLKSLRGRMCAIEFQMIHINEETNLE